MGTRRFRFPFDHETLLAKLTCLDQCVESPTPPSSFVDATSYCYSAILHALGILCRSRWNDLLALKISDICNITDVDCTSVRTATITLPWLRRGEFQSGSTNSLYQFTSIALLDIPSNMATLVVQQQAPLRKSRTPSPHPSGLTLDTSKFKSVPIPNKHLPYCSPGPAPGSQARTPATPPASPPSKQPDVQTLSILHPADNYTKIFNSPPVYSIDASTLALAIETLATQPLPEPKLIFPWLHGLHQDNQIQLAFFVARRKALRKTPTCLRGITLVKAGGDLSKSRLKGAISPRELLYPLGPKESSFLEVDPKDGFSVRNFHIQAVKMAMVSDVVIYRDENTEEADTHILAKRIARAQRSLREKMEPTALDTPVFNTFVVSCKSRCASEHAYMLFDHS